ncbi:MAG: hypothetical protein EBT47_07660, partial [Chloroflexi bacterium]|nr:hypothetical protein [Chloroflexota bacterium]
MRPRSLGGEGQPLDTGIIQVAGLRAGVVEAHLGLHGGDAELGTRLDGVEGGVGEVQCKRVDDRPVGIRGGARGADRRRGIPPRVAGIEEDVEGVPKDGDRPIEVGIVGSVPCRRRSQG